MVMFLAGLQDIPEVYYDAAKVDGATSLQVFRFITLPMLTPTIFFYLTMAFITVWYQFDLVYVMTGGGPVNSTIMPALVIYEAAFRDFRMGYAAAVAWVMFAITFIITFLHFKISGRWTFYGR
jgi:ABC-type sugar transport system permease subunit